MSKDFIKKAEPTVEVTEVNELQALKDKIAMLEQMLEAKATATVEEVEETEKADPSDVNAFLNERVPFFAFRDNDRYKDDIHVGVNGYNYVIQRGVRVMIPRFVKNVIEDAERQNTEAMRNAQNLIDQFMQATKERGIAI